MSKLRAKKIKLLLFDVDGVLTDGKLFIFPTPPGTQQTVQQHAAQHGGEGGFGLHSQTYIEAKGFHAHDGTAISLARQEGIKPAEVAFVGDDVIDLPVMWNCGLAIAVANARDEVKRDAHYVTPHCGGDGALRDAIEYILKAQGKWRQVVKSYVGERSGGNSS